MIIIVDAFGGDNAPVEIIRGCELAVKEYGINIKLVGKKDVINKAIEENNICKNNMEIVDAPDVITMDDKPGDIIRSKKDSSMALGLRLLANGEGDAFVSAGNSGALVMGATTIVKRIKGVKRPAFAPIVPKEEGFFMLIDCGANVDCKPQMLKQFAIMGSIYMEKVMKIKKPRVGLANIGTEEHKGGDLQKQAFTILKESDNINFIGNIEARDIPVDAADVVVSDGFTGNIILKTYEGVASTIMKKIKEVFSKNIRTKLAASIVYSDLKKMKKELDYNEYGGAPVIGIRAPVFKAHGSSNANTFKNAIKLLISYVNENVVSEISSNLEQPSDED